MTDSQGPYGWETVIRFGLYLIALFGTGALYFYFVGAAWLNSGLVSLAAYGPCSLEGNLTGTGFLAFPFGLLAHFFLLLYGITHPSYRVLVVAVVMSIVFWLVVWAASSEQAKLQQECLARSYPEAVRHCGVDPKNLRVSPTKPGYKVTLVGPGKTDVAFGCLVRWIHWHDNYSYDIDDSVTFSGRGRRLQ